MSDNDNGTDEAQSLKEQPYGDLMNAARSAREQFEEVNIDTNAPTKDELVTSMKQFGFDGSREEGWTLMVDGSEEEVDLLDVQTPEDGSSGSSGPTDTTILYGLSRAGTEEHIDTLREAVEENTDFEVRESGENGSKKFPIVLPAEEQEGFEEAQEDEEDEDDEEEDESEEEQAEEESEEEEEEDTSEEEETESEESEDDEEEEEDEEDLVPEDALRTRLNDRPKTGGDEMSVYEIATDLEVDGRSDMTKQELIDSIVEERIERGEVEYAE